MSTNTGQFGWKVESTAGTRAVPDRFVEFTGEGIRRKVDKAPRMGMRAGRLLPHGVRNGKSEIDGNTTFNVSAESVGDLLRLMIGDVSTAGSDPYTHTVTPGALESATCQFNRPLSSGTADPWDYLGCYANTWKLTGAIDQYLAAEIGWLAMSEAHDQSLASASYSQANWFTYEQGVVSLGGSEVCIDQIEFTGDNKVDTHHCMKSTGAGLPTYRELKDRDYGGTFVGDFESTTQYDHYTANDSVAISTVWTAGANLTLTIAGAVYYEAPDGPNAKSPNEIIKNSFPFKFYSSTNDATAFTATLVNSDATA